MKQLLFTSLVLLFSLCQVQAQKAAVKTIDAHQQLYIDVHYLPAGNVKFKDVAAAHAKDLAVQDNHGVQFLTYWVDEKKGAIYCLSAAADSTAVVETHKEAHGLLPQEIHLVTDGEIAPEKNGKTYFLDIHNLGAGKVTAADVAKAHQKDLQVQARYGVNFINYWVDESKGRVYCLSQASNTSKVVQTHKAAHGLLPETIVPVKQGH